MSEITSFIRFKGKVGNAVARRAKGGKAVIYEKPAYANPKSSKQSVVRNAQAFAAKFASMLGSVGRTSLLANGFPQSKFYELVKQLFPQVIAWGGEYGAGYPLMLVKAPTFLSSGITDLIVSWVNNTRQIKVALNGAQLDASTSFVVSIMLKDENDIWYSLGSMATNADNVTFDAIDSTYPVYAGCEIHAFAIAVKATNENGRAILSQINTPGNGGTDNNLSVDINRLSQDSFLYSQVYAGFNKLV